MLRLLMAAQEVVNEKFFTRSCLQEAVFTRES